MPKIVKPLSNLQVKNINKVGWHAVGGVPGLLLQVRKSTSLSSTEFSRSWVLRVKIGNKRQPIGLGSYPQVSLQTAREQAAKLSQEARQGVDLKARKKAIKSELIAAASKNKTFKECAEAYMDSHSSDYTNEKHRKQWAATLKTYAYPIIGNLLVSDIKIHHILDVLNQESRKKDSKDEKVKLWEIKTETAKRLLGRIKTVFDYAIVNGYRTGTNPALWQGHLSTLLPSPNKIKNQKHHPAVPYSKIGEFISALRKYDSISARALEFLVLTAVRSGSVRTAKWTEIDYEKKLWVIPPEHTKTRTEHRVPLQDQALELLKSLPRFENTDIIFPSPTGKVLSDMALNQVMRRMRDKEELEVEAVPHGFRSTFRDWAAEQTNYPDEIRKAASGHVVGDSVKEAYQRTDLLEKRRRLMTEWGDFLDKVFIQDINNTIPLRKTN